MQGVAATVSLRVMAQYGAPAEVTRTFHDGLEYLRKAGIALMGFCALLGGVFE
jgi:hypothetical protein